MHFKVIKGTPLFDTLMGVHEKLQESHKAIKALCKEVGADGHAETNYSYLKGEIAAFHFETCRPPSDAWMKKQECFFMPKSGKKFIEETGHILQKIKEIPKVKKELLMDAIKAEEQWYGGLTLFSRPGFAVYPEYILFSFPSEVKYEPVEGMVEILGSEFTALSKKEEALKYQD